MKYSLIASIVALLFAACSNPEPKGAVYCVHDGAGEAEIVEYSAATGEILSIINTPGEECCLTLFRGKIYFKSDKQGKIALCELIPETNEVCFVEDSSIADEIFSDTIKSSEWTAFLDDRRAVLWTPGPGVAPVRVSDGGETAGRPTISGTLQLLAYNASRANSRTKYIVVRSLPEGRILAIFDTDRDDMAPAFSPDGFWTAFQSGEGGDAKIALGYIPDGSIRILGKGRRPVWFDY